MKRPIYALIAKDLARKLVFVTGPRQVGKTTLSQQLLAGTAPAQYFNYDVAPDKQSIERQSWLPDSKLLVLDELHKMPNWKSWLKGVWDGRSAQQQVLVTGSARMDTFRQAGDSLAGRYFSWRLHPISVKEWMSNSPASEAGAAPSADEALTHLLKRGGFPEPCLYEDTPQGDIDALRWREQYANGLVREDVMEFSRIQELGSMRLLLDMLRTRVGSPLSLASLGRDLGLSQPTVKRYIDILQALYIVFMVQPWHHNIARSLQQAPKIYFFDTGMVKPPPGLTADSSQAQGARFENAVAGMLLKQVHFLQDSQAAPVGLHYVRDKAGAEIDFALSNENSLSHLIECKWRDDKPHRAFGKFGDAWPQAQRVQLVRYLRSGQFYKGVHIVPAAAWLAALDA
jgi:uncharacterized protein